METACSSETPCRAPGRAPAPLVAIQQDSAVRGGLQTGNDPVQRRLAAAGWTDDADEFAAVDFEGDVLERRHGLSLAADEGFADSLHVQDYRALPDAGKALAHFRGHVRIAGKVKRQRHRQNWSGWAPLRPGPVQVRRTRGKSAITLRTITQSERGGSMRHNSAAPLPVDPREEIRQPTQPGRIWSVHETESRPMRRMTGTRIHRIEIEPAPLRARYMAVMTAFLTDQLRDRPATSTPSRAGCAGRCRGWAGCRESPPAVTSCDRLAPSVWAASSRSAVSAFAGSYWPAPSG